MPIAHESSRPKASSPGVISFWFFDYGIDRSRRTEPRILGAGNRVEQHTGVLEGKFPRPLPTHCWWICHNA